MTYRHSQLSRVCILAILCTSSLAAEQGIAEAVRVLKPGRRVEVVLQNQDRLIGNIGTVSEDRFVLEPDRKGQPTRELRYADIQSIRTKWTRTGKWLIAGGVYGVLVVIGLIMGG